MRVLIVSTFFPTHKGGLEIVAGELAMRLAEAGVSVAWIAGAPPAPLPSRMIKLIPVSIWNFFETHLGIPYPIWRPRGIWRLAVEIRNADVIHMHDILYPCCLVAFLMAKLWKRPVLVTQHIDTVPYTNPILRFAMAKMTWAFGRLILGRADQVVFCSKKVQVYFSRFVEFKQPSQYLPNGVAAKAFKPLLAPQRAEVRSRYGYSNAKPLLLFVGRFVEKKGMTYLRQLVAQFPECQWVFIGWGPFRPESWELNNLHCIGALKQEEIIPYYQMADLLVLPSVGEGFPLVVQEAMSCGTPALVTRDTAGGAEGLDPSLILTAELTVEAFAAEIAHFLQNRVSDQASRDRVRAFAASNWDWSVTVEKYLNLLMRLACQHDAKDILKEAS